jgi:hypothetical protein
MPPARVDRRDGCVPGSVEPRASVTHAIVEAVPIVMQQCLFERDIEFSISTHSRP